MRYTFRRAPSRTVRASVLLFSELWLTRTGTRLGPITSPGSVVKRRACHGPPVGPLLQPPPPTGRRRRGHVRTRVAHCGGPHHRRPRTFGTACGASVRFCFAGPAAALNSIRPPTAAERQRVGGGVGVRPVDGAVEHAAVSLPVRRAHHGVWGDSGRRQARLWCVELCSRAPRAAGRRGHLQRDETASHWRLGGVANSWSGGGRHTAAQLGARWRPLLALAAPSTVPRKVHLPRAHMLGHMNRHLSIDSKPQRRRPHGCCHRHVYAVAPVAKTHGHPRANGLASSSHYMWAWQ